MNDMPENRHLRFMLKLFYLLFTAAVFYIIYKYMIRWLLPFIISFIVAACIQRPIRFLSEKCHIPRKASCIILVLFVYGVLGAAAYGIIHWFITELQNFISTIPQFLSDLPSVIDKISAVAEKYYKFLPEGYGQPLKETLTSIVGKITSSSIDLPAVFGTVKDVAFSIPTVLIFVISLFVGSYYISADYSKIIEFILAQLPDKVRESSTRLVRHLLTTLGNWVKAVLILMGITFVELLIGFLLMRLDYAVVLAIMVAFVDALPVFGVGTVLIPWVLFSLITGSFMRALYLALLYIVITIIRNSIEPKILGGRIGLNPLLMLICLYLGYVTLGILGMFVLPVCFIAIERLQAWGYIHLFNTPEYMKEEPEDFPDPVETLKRTIRRKRRAEKKSKKDE